MRALLCYLLALLPLFTLQAQDNEEIQEYKIEGTVTAISKDSILTIKIIETSEVAPLIKQKVEVIKKFVMGNMKGTMGVADGAIVSYGNGIVKVQVLKYTSTMEQDGKRVPMIKVENTAVLKWKMKPVPTYASEYKKAKKMITAENYRAAIPLLDSLLGVKMNEEVLYDRGYCRFQVEEYDAAIADMTEVIKLYSEYKMAYYIRAMANARLKRNEEALSDLDMLLALGLDEDSEKHILEDHAYLVYQLNKADKKEKLCKDYKRLYQLESSNLNYYNDKNCYCNNYGIPKLPPNYLPLGSGEQSSDKFTLTIKALKKGKYKWYDKDHTLNKKVEVGAYVNLDQISDGSCMNIAVAQVTKVEGDVIELKIQYWSIRMNSDPYIIDLNTQKTDLILTW